VNVPNLTVYASLWKARRPPRHGKENLEFETCDNGVGMTSNDWLGHGLSASGNIHPERAKAMFRSRVGHLGQRVRWAVLLAALGSSVGCCVLASPEV
jgi:hypothetical protein